jgi:uncharacterized coiled-coil protein SlyX
MKISTFNNTVVGLVSSYAEVLAEQAQLIEQLQEALRQAVQNPAGSNPSQNQALTQAAGAVVAAWKEYEKGATEVDALMESLKTLASAVQGA